MLRIQPPLARQAAVMAGHLVLLPALSVSRAVMPLGQLARVDENQRRAMGFE